MEGLKESIITIKDLKIRFEDNQVLKGINLDLYKGQIIGFIGPNGVGKSTTIDIMLGLLQGYEGQVKILGQDISDDGVDYKKRIGYIPVSQDTYNNLTAREYFKLIAELYELDYDTAHNKAYDLMKQFSLDHVYDSKIFTLSKGMKQRVLIISTLFHNPDIVFLDEPLSGLDKNSVMVLKEILSSMAAEGKTIFYSSHVIDVVEKISNRIIILNNGEVVADGSLDALKEKFKKGSLIEIFNLLTAVNENNEITEEPLSTVQGEN